MSTLAALLLLMAQDPQATRENAVLVEDVVVTGRAPALDPFELFRALCFDANRLDGQAFRPTVVPEWTPLPAESGSDEEVFVRSEGDLDLVLRIRERPDRQLTAVQHNDCILSLAGPHDQQALERGMRRVMGAAGTTRHLDRADLFTTHPGWTQLAWTAIPDRDVTRWTAFSPDLATTSSFVMVIDPGFYRRRSYVVTELRYTDEGPTPVSHISLKYLTGSGR
jgi:hypothetical protein